MKLPTFLNKFKKKQLEQTSDIFLTLIVHVEWIHVAVWEMGQGKKPHILGISLTQVRENTWDARIEACDRLLGELEEKVGIKGPKKVIFGLPSVYLTDTGDIDKTVKREIKQLSHVLDLIPMGFVSLADAFLYSLRQEEGVPSNIILIDVSKKQLTIALYKIGKLIGQKTVAVDQDVVGPTESVLRSFHDVEILPSRMLLFDGDVKLLEQVQSVLLHHSWSTRANFLHFPKIDILSAQELLRAVSLAGASELAVQIPDEEDADEPGGEEPVGEEMQEDEKGTQGDEEKDMQDEKTEDEVQEKEDEVLVVEPEALGFRRKEHTIPTQHIPPVDDSGNGVITHESGVTGEKERASSVLGGFINFIQTSMSKRAVVGIILFLLVTGALMGLLYWLIPRATMTIYITKKIIDESASVTIDPTATVADIATMIIPGRKREQSISGEKVIPVEGKKKIGDPARGVVTIYNKSLSARTFKNGAVLSTDSIQFTLESDIQVASASENLVNGTVTFGKATVPIVAVAIGEGGNLPAGREFLFKDTAVNIAVARNETPLSGGSSREATVVTRADYDALIKTLTGELVSKAKAELGTAVTGREKLIDETIATTVKEKSFTRELDSEAGELGGKLTLSVSGISYSEDDIVSLFMTRIQPSIPTGYEITQEQMSVKVTSVKINKNGQISLSAEVSIVALPVFDDDKIRQDTAGKSITDVQEYLRNIEGVGGVGFNLRYTFTKKRLPINKNNIIITRSMTQ